MKFSFHNNDGKTSGKYCFCLWKEKPYYREWNFHFFIQKQKPERFWGFREDWYDGPIYSFGLGWFFLMCWL